ncbi:glycosyltransferase family 1 protein [Candidatus Amarolinea dominans]|uniref:glycosyltransferase family 4 protein n=1 Tax=Candidatus Amarolinea dominans TaxID=3140696 RepID=UPI0031CCA799
MLDLRTVQDHFPGIGRYAFHLAQALVEAAPTWRFTLLTQAQGANTRFDVAGLARWPNVILHAVPQAIFSWQEQITLPRALPPGDLIHFPYYIRPYLSRRRTVVTIYDIISRRYPEYLPSALHRVIFEITTRLALASAAHILTLSASAAPICSASTGLTLAASPSRRPRPMRASGPHRSQTSTRCVNAWACPRATCFSWAPTSPTRTCRAWWRPGASSRHRRRAPLPAWRGVSLVLAGREDPRYVGIRATIAQAGLQDDIMVLGAVSEADLPVLYSGAEAFILPSLYEGYGLPVIEAMACGVAVACSNTSSLPEVVGGDAGVLFDPADSDEMAAVLRRLLTDGALRTTLQQTGLARARQFTWQRTAELTLAGYEEGILTPQLTWANGVMLW